MKLRIVKCRQLPQWIIESDKAAYHPYSNTIYLTMWKYLPHEMLHYFACMLKLTWMHKLIDWKLYFIKKQS